MLKTYTFRTLKQRSSFVSGLMSYETAVKHMGRISMNGTDVTVQLWTDGIDSVSELDREYAAFADTAYKDVTYCTHSEDKI